MEVVPRLPIHKNTQGGLRALVGQALLPPDAALRAAVRRDI
jgi:hypothetical protein